MVRPVSSRDNQIQAEAPAPPALVGTPTPSAPTAKSSRFPLGWQLALFVWLASFAFLLLNELLTAVVKLVSRLF